MADNTFTKLQRQRKREEMNKLLVTMDPTELNADLFEPAPDHCRQLLPLPSHLKRLCMDSLRKELRTLSKENTFIKEEKPPDEPIISVTAKSRAKDQASSKLEKAKIRVCLRCGQQ